MAMSGAEIQRAYRARQKAKREAGDPEALELYERKLARDRAFSKNNREALRVKENERYHRKMQEDPLYRQRRRDEAKLFVERHPEEVAARRKDYRERTVEQRAEYMAQWERENPDKRKAITLKRVYAIEETMVEPIDRWLVWETDLGVCGLCGEDADPSDWHLDHVIPLSRGGSHTYDNVQVSHPACNIRKGNTVSG